MLLLILSRGYFSIDFLYREWKGGREREREGGVTDVRETHQFVPSPTHPDLGQLTQERTCPWLGIKPVTFGVRVDAHQDIKATTEHCLGSVMSLRGVFIPPPLLPPSAGRFYKEGVSFMQLLFTGVRHLEVDNVPAVSSQDRVVPGLLSFLNFFQLKIILLKLFSITVYIQYYSVFVSGVQHSG